MIAVKMELNFEAMQILMCELQQSQMWAIHLMRLGVEMTDNVTKFDLTKIIEVMGKKLKWIGDHEDISAQNNNEEQIKNENKNFPNDETYSQMSGESFLHAELSIASKIKKLPEDQIPTLLPSLQ